MTDDHLKVLSKGFKFTPTPTSLNIIDSITNTETALYSAPALTKQLAISEVTTFVSNWKKPSRTNLSKKDFALLKEIKRNEQIIVVPADKGNKVVIMDREKYIEKIDEKLNDNNMFEEIKDPTNSLKKKISALANRLFNKNRINELQKNSWSQYDNLPYIRGQIKLHKPDQSMRIITSTRSSILSSVSGFVLNMIKQLKETVEHTLTDTNHLISEMSKIKLENDDRLVSLDVVDLFTNVPVSKAITIVLSRIGNSEKFCESSLTKSDLRELLELCLKHNYFTFNGKIYRQINGLPMGNKLSQLVADIYLDHHLKEQLNKANDKTWRYVDDLLLITKMTKEQTKDYVDELNSAKQSIKFTFEYENNGQINYLDTTLIRNTTENKIDMQWFRKTNSSDRFLKYHSCHHKSIKTNLAKNMAKRILNITTCAKQQKTDISTLKFMLQKSDCPKNEIEKIIQEVMREHNTVNSRQTIVNRQQTTTQIKEKDEWKFRLSLPYYPGIEILKRRLEKLKIKLHFSYPNKLSSFLPSYHHKQSRSVIYKISCECKAQYIGETKISLEQRMCQHYQLIEKDSDETKSEMVQHHKEKRW